MFWGFDPSARETFRPTAGSGEIETIALGKSSGFVIMFGSFDLSVTVGKTKTRSPSSKLRVKLPFFSGRTANQP